MFTSEKSVLFSRKRMPNGDRKDSLRKWGGAGFLKTPLEKKTSVMGLNSREEDAEHGTQTPIEKRMKEEESCGKGKEERPKKKTAG